LGRVPLFSPDGTTLVLGEMNGGIRLLSLKTGLTHTTIPGPTEGNGIMALAFSPDGRLLASGYGLSDGTIRLWDTVTGAPAGSLEGHRGWVSKLVFAPDGRTLYSGSSDQTIRVWDVVQKQEIETDRLRGHTSRLSGLALCRDGNTLVSCAFDGSIRVWALKSKPQRGSHAVLPVRVGPYGAPFTRDSRHLITASPRDPVIIWEVATAKEIQRLPALGTNHHSVALSPDERLLAVGSLDGTIRIWDLTGQRLVKEFRPQSIPIFGLRFWDAGKTLVSHAMVWNRQIAVQRWDVASWVEIPFGRMDVSDGLVMAQSPDHCLLAVPSGAGVKLWDYATGELKAAFPSEAGAIMAAFSTDNRLLAAAISGEARVWEVNSGRELAALSLHANGVISVTFSPDGQRLVTGGEVGMRLQPALVVWDYTIQRQLISLQSDGGFKGWTQFSPDGNTLLGLSWPGVADLYRAPSWEEIEAKEKEPKAP
jgi:WD40 repeat protein